MSIRWTSVKVERNFPYCLDDFQCVFYVSPQSILVNIMLGEYLLNILLTQRIRIKTSGPGSTRELG